MPSRRTFPGTVATIAVAGCTGRSDDRQSTMADRDGDGVPDRGDDYPNDPNRASQSFHAEGGDPTTVPPGEFRAIALTNSPTASGDVLHYDASVQGDSRIDCLVFERDAYDHFERGARDVPIVEAYSRTGVRDTSLTKRLDRGEYIFVLDNTAQSTTATDSPVAVEYVVDIAKPPSE